MHLIEIVIDGFKSYSVRTSIENLDPQFNAITGLNGSGKSNILDSICFVMGISRMALIRVEKMQELVYNGGKSGVSKASVTLKFENKDKNMSPPNYIDCESITVTRTIENNKVKCFINGKVESQERVRDLFTSVKLNVNNPHFLIMQGRITKVINMNKKELLELLEEASGVSQYQTKKEQTKELIKKKDMKIQETNSILEHDVIPQFEALTKDKLVFDQFNKLQGDIDEKEKLMRAYDYHEYNSLIGDQAGQFSKLTQDELSYKTRKAREEKDLASVKDQIEQKLKQHSTAETDKIDQQINKTTKQILESDAGLKASEKQLQQFTNLEVETKQKIEQLGLDEHDLQRKITKCKKQSQQLQTDLEKKKDEVKAAEQNLKALESGGSGEDQMNALKQQIEQIKLQLEDTQQQIQQINNGKSQHKQRLVQAEKELQRVTQDTQTDQNKEKSLNDRIGVLANELKGYAPLAQTIATQQASFDKMRQKQRQSIEDQNVQQVKYMCEFQYPSPYSEFDRSQVYGRISTLFTVKDIDKHGTALGEVAGGNLRHIVVERSMAAKEILNSKLLQQREAFEPLDMINSQRLQQSKVDEIKTKTDGKAQLAIDLIEFNPKYTKIMEKVFGYSFVTDNDEVAKKVSAQYNCVTLNGDSYKQNGLLSGGHNKQGNRLLQIQQYLQREASSMKQGQEMDKLFKEIQILKKQQEEFDERRRELERMESQLRILKEQQGFGQGSSVGAAQDQVRRLMALSEDFDEDLTKATQKALQQNKELAELSSQVKQNQGQGQAKFLKQRFQNLKEQKVSIEEQLKEINTMQTQIEMKSEEITKEQGRLQANLNSETQAAVDLTSIFTQQKVKANDLKKAKQELIKNLEAEQQSYAKQTQEISDLQNLAQKKQNQIEELGSQIEQTNNDKKTFEHRRKIAVESLQKLKNDYPYLVHEQKGKHRFDQMDPQKMVEELQQLTTQRDELRKRVNFNIELMFEKTQKWHQELLLKRDTLIQNKESIVETIRQLDDEKNKDLQNTVKEVNINLRDIFSTLLPNVTAGLRSSYDGDLLTGLVLVVAFNGVEKQSLSELSGGQRSLLALSLILALLKYQPAPLYILDEIDSALDLSHTQNIGIMIKKFFHQSQFLIVSLKDGLFQNANVLYKIQFKENRSTVTRLQIPQKPR